VGAACALTATPASAQAVAAAGLDAGAARVHYDDFLPSYSTFVTTDARVAIGGTSLGARGTALRFESGRASLQGSVAASQLVPTAGRVRARLSGAAGASRYAGFAPFTHALASVRLEHDGRRRGAWAGPTLGSTSFGEGWRPVAQLAAGVWSLVGPGALDASLAATTVGDTTYADAEAHLRLLAGRATLDGWVGARMLSRGAGRGVYGEASAALPLRGPLALVAGAGRYPTDPIRGSIAGSYVSVGLRLGGRFAPRPARPAPRPATASGSDGDHPAPAPTLEVAAAAVGDLRVIRVLAAGALAVELAGDFTDWRPIALAPVGAGRWEVALRVPPGPRRLNVRVDGGAWQVPAGVTRVVDGFGTDVGILVVP
jgi:hypothetical protein